MQTTFAWIPLTSTLLLACNNPAPLDDAAEAAGAPAALDRAGGACQLAERAANPITERSHGLYTPHDAGPNSYAGSELPCAASLAGSYGVRVELDVYVQDGASAGEHDPGRGRASVLLRADIDRTSEDEADVALQLCGLDLPARYAYASSAVTKLQLPAEIWDRPNMPRWKSRIHPAALDGDPTLHVDAFAMLLGITLRAPEAAWPSFDQTPAFECEHGASGEECFPDHDGDGQPGLSFRTQAKGDIDDAPYPACADWHFAGPSTDNHAWSSSTATEASRMFVGLRTALQLFLRFDRSCTEASGTALAADIMTRVLDCELTDEKLCSPRQATVIDERAPSFHVLDQGETPPESFRDSRSFVNEALDRSPSTGGQVTLQRLPDAAINCETVRAALAQ